MFFFFRTLTRYYDRILLDNNTKASHKEAKKLFRTKCLFYAMEME